MSTRRKRPGGNPARTASSTGIRIEARHRHHAELPAPKHGEHQWTVLAMWRVIDPTADRFDLDVENLLNIEGPGCFVCEQPWTSELADRPCPGEPG